MSRYTKKPSRKSKGKRKRCKDSLQSWRAPWADDPGPAPGEDERGPLVRRILHNAIGWVAHNAHTHGEDEGNHYLFSSITACLFAAAEIDRGAGSTDADSFADLARRIYRNRESFAMGLGDLSHLPPTEPPLPVARAGDARVALERTLRAHAGQLHEDELARIGMLAAVSVGMRAYGRDGLEQFLESARREFEFHAKYALRCAECRWGFDDGDPVELDGDYFHAECITGAN